VLGVTTLHILERAPGEETPFVHGEAGNLAVEPSTNCVPFESVPPSDLVCGSTTDLSKRSADEKIIPKADGA